MQFNEIITILRESKSLTREQLARMIELSSSAIDKFEKTNEGISHSNKIKIADIFNIDHEYINNKTAYPFGCNNFFKFHMLSKGIFPGFPGYEPLFTILELSRNIEIVSLMPELSGIKKITQRSIFEEPAYAIALRDKRNNIFLLRRKKENDFIMWGGGLKSPLLRILEIAKLEDRNINLALSTKQLADSQYKKIKSKWDNIKREDLEQFFRDSEKFNKIYEPTNSEIELLQVLKKENVQSLTTEDLLLIKKSREYKDSLSTYEIIHILENEIKRRKSTV